MEGPEWVEPSDAHDKEATKQSRWSEHCKTFLIRDAHGAIKELVFPRGLDLDRPKRERTIFSSRQLGCLEEEFKQNQYLVGKERSAVAKRLGLSETQVKVWFQNRRTKHKKDNERCGEGKDFHAESKAARNVLKLLEYKTALNYSTLLGQTPTQLDTYRSLSAGSVDFLVCQSPNILNDHKEKTIDTNVKQDILDPSPENTIGVGFEASTVHLQVTNGNVFSTRDIAPIDVPVNMIPKCSSVSSSSDLFHNSNDVLLQQHINPNTATDIDIRKSPGGLEGTSLKAQGVGSNRRLRIDSSYCVEKLLKHSDFQTDGIACEDLSQDDSANSEECIIQARGKLHEEIPTRMQSKEDGKTEAPPVCARFHPFTRFAHTAVETSQESWQNEEHRYNLNNTPCRLPLLQGCAQENRTCANDRPVHGTTSVSTTSREIHGGMFPNPYSNRSMGQYFSNVMSCPGNTHNTYLSYQPIMVNPGQVSLNPQQLPYLKHYNYYVPSLYGPGANDTPAALQVIPHAPASNPYGDGLPQRSYSSFTTSTPQTRFLSQPTVYGLSSQYHRYPMGTPFS